MSEPLKMTLTRDGAHYMSLDVDGTLLVGSGRAADVQIEAKSLAPLHLRLHRDDRRLIATALAPAVCVEGRELELGESCDVTEKSIDIGALRLVSATLDDRPQRTESMARELMRKILGHGADGAYQPQPEFVVEGGPANGQRRAFSKVEERVIIGRGESATWILLDPDLSRNHAAVERHDDGFRIYDMRSKNGTKVNGKPVGIGAPGIALDDGAVITLGDTRIRFVDPAAAMIAEIEANADAAARGIPGAITQTRPGHGRAFDAASASAAGDERGRAHHRALVAIVVSAMIATVAAGLLIALLASS
jgi:hypothetical protein